MPFVLPALEHSANLAILPDPARMSFMSLALRDISILFYSGRIYVAFECVCLCGAVREMLADVTK